MALSVTSAPWHEVNLPGLDLRRYLSARFFEGVVGTGDMAVTQRGAGANFSVDIAAGEALVQGDAITNQGKYYAYNDATFNLTGFTAANASNPRVDRVALRVRDNFHDASGFHDLAFVILTGTATAGANLTNLTNAAAVPANHLLLANVLIPATATSITTANIDTTVRSTVGVAATTASLFANGPPGSPADGDIWIGLAVDTGNLATTSGTTWHFRYNASSGNTDKWEFVGGIPFIIANDNTTAGNTGGAWVVSVSYAVVRSGAYFIANGQFQGTNNGGATGTYSLGLGLNSSIQLGLGSQSQEAGFTFATGCMPAGTSRVTAAGTVNAMIATTGTCSGASIRMAILPIRVS